eukprot:CAMPEP_0206005752 /NCGR_PEP_ID=MMETSP1464-20131121/4769_1 /ASSEMBLY_ACC=CAM_ASM_001124 /TAXON_ID=119497 /ORGANISM="Exanthemachrysis gayraliae, Strain RCC1523" /LENGTH=70 /DNA_ID=CAMNT_0053379207 /DNA_START=199 /DNA_END=409 /DNA_ORIENTATION=+
MKGRPATRKDGAAPLKDQASAPRWPIPLAGVMSTRSFARGGGGGCGRPSAFGAASCARPAAVAASARETP